MQERQITIRGLRPGYRYSPEHTGLKYHLLLADGSVPYLSSIRAAGGVMSLLVIFEDVGPDPVKTIALDPVMLGILEDEELHALLFHEEGHLFHDHHGQIENSTPGTIADVPAFEREADLYASQFCKREAISTAFLKAVAVAYQLPPSRHTLPHLLKCLPDDVRLGFLDRLKWIEEE